MGLYAELVHDVETRDRSGCWPWPHAKNADGYGRVTKPGDSGANRRVSRESLALSLGRPLAPGASALHSCDNPPCYNPDHLREGTQAENVRDAIDRERNHRGKLSANEVANLLADLADGATIKGTARRYKIKPSSVRYHRNKART